MIPHDFPDRFDSLRSLPAVAQKSYGGHGRTKGPVRMSKLFNKKK